MQSNDFTLIPFPSIREGQKAFMEDVKDAVEGEKILIAHAPTGIGKTVAALAPSLQYAIENDKMVFFLTSKRTQHKIAIDTLRMIKEANKLDFVAVDVISKQAMCPRPISTYKGHYSLFNEFCKIEQRNRRCHYFLNHDEEALQRIKEEIMHVEELCGMCVNRGICPYKTALEVSSSADVLVCDYNYLFSKDISEKALEKIETGLEEIIVIVDEAHNLPERIRSNLSNELRMSTITGAAKGIRSINRELYENLLDLERIFKKLTMNANAARNKREETNVDREFLVEEIEKVLRRRIEARDYDDFVNSLKNTAEEIESTGGGKYKNEIVQRQRNVLSMANFLEAWKTEEECLRIFRHKETPMLYFKLLDPSIISKPIFIKAHSTIMMSGTLCPPEMYADVLGAAPDRIHGKEIVLKEYKSPFPKENRLILVTKDLTTKYSRRSEEMYMKIAMKICEVVKYVKGGMAVFFPSYELLERIARYFPAEIRENAIVEKREMKKEEKNELYEILRSEECILLGVQGGSLSEGIDYESNALKAIIVVGLPLSPPTLEVKDIEGYYVRKYGDKKGKLYGYVFPAITKVLQAAGRGIRNEKDRCLIVLMDYRFAQIPYKRCFPRDYDMIFTDRAEEFCYKFFNSIPIPQS